MVAIVTGVLDALKDVFFEIGNGILKSLPGLLAAIVILLVGYFVALLVEWALKNVLKKIKLDEYLVKKTNIVKAVGNLSLENLLSLLAKWYVFILFFMPAADVVKWNTLADFLKGVAEWVPTIIGASLLGLFGVVAANYVRQKVSETKVKSADLVADFVKTIILVITALVVLGQVGFDLDLVEDSLLVLLAGVMLALALALGLGFGLALKEEAKGLVKNLLKKL